VCPFRSRTFSNPNNSKKVWIHFRISEAQVTTHSQEELGNQGVRDVNGNHVNWSFIPLRDEGVRELPGTLQHVRRCVEECLPELGKEGSPTTGSAINETFKGDKS
jgi:hypothetical protein